MLHSSSNKSKDSEEPEGQLSIDVYHDDHSIYIVALIAGAKSSDVDISITDETVTIKGERFSEPFADSDGYYLQECYWGSFSRSYKLPIPVNAESSKATLKDGVLRIEIPKDEKAKTRVIKVNDK